jgi:hypothetical protein
LFVLILGLAFTFIFLTYRFQMQGNILNTAQDHPADCVLWTADVSFKSQISFCISTKLTHELLKWVSSSAIPVSVHVQLTELQGTIIFGVDGDKAQLSFKREPQLSFTLLPEIGSHFKLSRIPKFTNLMIRVIKQAVCDKLVFPNMVHFSLPWEQSWKHSNYNSFLTKFDSRSQVSNNQTPTVAIDTSKNDTYEIPLWARILHALMDKNDHLLSPDVDDIRTPQSVDTNVP